MPCSNISGPILCAYTLEAPFPRGLCIVPTWFWQGLSDSELTFVFAGCLLEQEPADSASLFTLLNILWRMNTHRMRDRVNIAVKIKR